MYCSNNDGFLSISVRFKKQNTTMGPSHIENEIFVQLKNILDEICVAITKHVVSLVYKLKKPHEHIEINFISNDIANGVIRIVFSFKRDDIFQRNLRLLGTEINDALLTYIKQIKKAIEYEETQCSLDLNVAYMHSNKLLGKVEIILEKNRILYGNKNFIYIVKSIGQQLIKLHEINPEFNVQIENKSDSIKLFPTTALLGKSTIKNKQKLQMIGKVYPSTTKGIKTHYIFIRHGTTKELLLITSDSESIKILDRAFTYNDYISIYFTPLFQSERGKKLPCYKIKLREILTKTRGEREELNRDVANYLLI